MTRRNIIMSAIYQIWHFFFNQRFITWGLVADPTKSGTFFFFKKNHQFITRGAKVDRGKYIVPT